MDIDYKKNFIIVNYPTGAFGSFLSHCLYRSGKFYFNNSSEVFDSSGAAHKNQPKVIKNFHQYRTINEWTKKDINDRIQYLNDNLTVNYNPDLFYLLRITSPEHTKQLEDIFDSKKIIEVAVDHNMDNLLEEIIMDKIYNVYDFVDINGKDYNPKLKSLFAKQSVKYFIEHSHAKQGNNIIRFSDFFNWEKFINSFNKITNTLEISVNHDEIKILYGNFKIANEKYFSIYNTLSYA